MHKYSSCIYFGWKHIIGVNLAKFDKVVWTIKVVEVASHKVTQGLVWTKKLSKSFKMFLLVSCKCNEQILSVYGQNVFYYNSFSWQGGPAKLLQELTSKQCYGWKLQMRDFPFILTTLWTVCKIFLNQLFRIQNDAASFKFLNKNPHFYDALLLYLQF